VLLRSPFRVVDRCAQRLPDLGYERAVEKGDLDHRGNPIGKIRNPTMPKRILLKCCAKKWAVR